VDTAPADISEQDIDLGEVDLIDDDAAIKMIAVGYPMFTAVIAEAFVSDLFYLLWDVVTDLTHLPWRWLGFAKQKCSLTGTIMHGMKGKITL
jgi:hypothetical protein